MKTREDSVLAAGKSGKIGDRNVSVIKIGPFKNVL
jgi:hypothetical protein